MKAQMESLFPFWKRFEVEYKEFMLPARDGVEIFTQLFTFIFKNVNIENSTIGGIKQPPKYPILLASIAS